jgi:hypothetical protein
VGAQRRKEGRRRPVACGGWVPFRLFLGSLEKGLGVFFFFELPPPTAKWGGIGGGEARGVVVVGQTARARHALFVEIKTTTMTRDSGWVSVAASLELDSASGSRWARVVVIRE